MKEEYDNKVANFGVKKKKVFPKPIDPEMYAKLTKKYNTVRSQLDTL